MKTKLSVAYFLLVIASILLIFGSILFIFDTYNSLIEPRHVLAEEQTKESIQAFSPELVNYITHIQIILGGAGIALAIALLFFAFGIKKKQKWAWWGAFISFSIWGVIGFTTHYIYGYTTLKHLGLFYLLGLIFIIGMIISGKELFKS